jgi:hypothetical protein
VIKGFGYGARDPSTMALVVAQIALIFPRMHDADTRIAVVGSGHGIGDFYHCRDGFQGANCSCDHRIMALTTAPGAPIADHWTIFMYLRRGNTG